MDREPIADEADRDSERESAEEAKSIVLFSDGTGNSSAKLFKTNVWRMYEAVDLGPSSAGKRKQVAFYDNGVGTSALRPLAAIAGIFGFGLKRNILEIYRHACRNYVPGPDQRPGETPADAGDHIYGFGFSRGAFTMRLVIALIASQGLVESKSEAELIRKSKDAFRAFRADFEPRRLKLPTRWYRSARDWLSLKWRKRKAIPPYSKEKNHRPVIRFVGLWDTVGAYGGPITEITRAIDNWVYALSMPDYKLHPNVRCARHALAIDDERDAFHPLLWDELEERALVKAKVVAPDRLRQLWFTGMHADVGGGYPDESLSYVSLLWILKEANDQGLRTLEVVSERIRALASSAGPLHNSRSGPGAYYRYQPRKISAWMHPRDPATRFQQDPDRLDDEGNALGFIPTVQIHESVAARIAFGTDRYAPITLPAAIKVVPPHPGGETAVQRDNVTPVVPPGTRRASEPLLAEALRKRFEDEKFGRERVARMEAVWDLVWRRRIAYFFSLALTLLLVFLPLWIGSAFDPPFLADGRTWLGEVIRLLNVILPEFLHGWVNSAASNAFYVLVLGIGLIMTLRYSSRLERRLRDHARAIWEHCLDLKNEEAQDLGQPEPRLRTSAGYQAFMQKAKWTIAPGLIGLLILALMVWAALGFATQVWLPFYESSGRMCPRPKAEAAADLDVVRLDFSPSNLCNPAKRSVKRGERYAVELEIVKPWKDGSIATAPTGVSASRMGWRGYAGLPLRRIVNAAYLQPAYLIRSKRKGWQFADPVYIQPLKLVPVGENGTTWHAEFQAERDGELSLFANDAMLPITASWLYPFDYRYFYQQSGSGEDKGNSGTACVTVTRADRVGSSASDEPEKGSPCAEAVARAAAAAEAERQAAVERRAERIRLRRARREAAEAEAAAASATATPAR
jgi:uncharacterized protein (DUF2235 family)